MILDQGEGQGQDQKNEGRTVDPDPEIGILDQGEDQGQDQKNEERIVDLDPVIETLGQSEGQDQDQKNEERTAGLDPEIVTLDQKGEGQDHDHEKDQEQIDQGLRAEVNKAERRHNQDLGLEIEVTEIVIVIEKILGQIQGTKKIEIKTKEEVDPQKEVTRIRVGANLLREVLILILMNLQGLKNSLNQHLIV